MASAERFKGKNLFSSHSQRLSRAGTHSRHESLESRAMPSAGWVTLGPAPILDGHAPGSQNVSGRVAAIAANPTNAMVLYLAATNGGVWKTTNGGQTWTP